MMMITPICTPGLNEGAYSSTSPFPLLSFLLLQTLSSSTRAKLTRRIPIHLKPKTRPSSGSLMAGAQVGGGVGFHCHLPDTMEDAF